ncbi:hypothetical protein Tco_0930371 [Tanacetum coccineum]
MEWKPTGKVFTSVGHRWLPTGRTFTINGTKYPMTRIASNPIVLPKETSQTPVITPNPEVKVVQIFLCTVRFGNDHIANIMGYGDYQIRNVTTSQFLKLNFCCTKPNLKYLQVFGALCYPTNDNEDLDLTDYGEYLRRLDELTAMASEQSSSGPVLHEMTPGTTSLGLVQNHPLSTPYVLPTKND